MSHAIETLSRVGDAISEQRRAALEKLFTRVGDVTALPESALNVVRLASKPDADPQAVCEAIKQDPALAAKVLRSVNSSRYGLRHKVGNLQMAISLLGLREVKAIAHGVYMSKMFTPSGSYKTYTRKDLWKHSVAVARMSEHVAKKLGKVDPEMCYYGGLLHDIGLLIIDQSMHRPFCEILDRISDGADLRATEREILTFDHTHLGAFVTEHWKMPPVIVAAAQYHHDPQEYQGEYESEVKIVAIANFFVSRHGIPALGVDSAKFPGDEVFRFLGLSDQDCLAIVDEMPSVLQKAEEESEG